MGGVTTYYVGNYYEWTGSMTSMVKYYYAGGQRVAMRQGSSTLYFLLGDHLGSTSLTANSNGTLYTEQRYYPWGDTRYNSPATTPTAYQYTGQRKDATGLYFYNARYYDSALGRFLSADTIVPSPANPQSLNRYSYVLNSPLRYTDPSGHFEEDEIDRYLEHQLGISDPDERQSIIQQWHSDAEWWAVIGPGGATYGDILDGTRLIMGQPSTRIVGGFGYDKNNNTFRFVAEEAYLEIVSTNKERIGLGWQTTDSLVDFYDSTDDMLWVRPKVDGTFRYMGGTGYATNNAPLQWNELGSGVWHTAASISAGLLSIGDIVGGTKVLGIVGLAVCVGEASEARQGMLNWARSRYANTRYQIWEP